MLPWNYVRAAIQPLRFIFWGGILWIFDLSLTFSVDRNLDFKFDFLDDTVGTILIAIGVFRLSSAPVSGDYSAMMRFVKIVALASVVKTTIVHFVFPHPPLLAFVFTALGLCQLAAIVLFCLAMKRFCWEAGLPEIAGSWQVTFLLFCFINCLPLGFLYLASFNALLGGPRIHMDLGPTGLLLLPVFAAPLFHLFVSTSRMRRAAESR